MENSAVFIATIFVYIATKVNDPALNIVLHTAITTTMTIGGAIVWDIRAGFLQLCFNALGLLADMLTKFYSQ